MHPLLESDTIECVHKGKVVLQSSNKDLCEINDFGVIVESDLLNAKIVGCTYTTLGVSTPCTCITSIPQTCISRLLEINNQGAILAEQISQILTDKGFPLVLNGEAQAVFEVEE